MLLLFETEPSQRSTVFTSEKITNVCRPQMFMTQMVKDMFITDEALVTIQCYCKHYF